MISRRRRRYNWSCKWIVGLICLCWWSLNIQSVDAQSGQIVRAMQWDLDDARPYSEARRASARTVIEYAKPDILILQGLSNEIEVDSAVLDFSVSTQVDSIGFSSLDHGSTLLIYNAGILQAKSSLTSVGHCSPGCIEATPVTGTKEKDPHVDLSNVDRRESGSSYSKDREND